MGNIEVKIFQIGDIDDYLLTFAVIGAKYRNKWIFCRHKNRNTWEIPGGHREPNEDILETAKRELREETGAKKFTIKPLAAYSVKKKNDIDYGKLLREMFTPDIP